MILCPRDKLEIVSAMFTSKMARWATATNFEMRRPRTLWASVILNGHMSFRDFVGVIHFFGCSDSTSYLLFWGFIANDFQSSKHGFHSVQNATASISLTKAEPGSRISAMEKMDFLSYHLVLVVAARWLLSETSNFLSGEKWMPFIYFSAKWFPKWNE